MKYSKNIDGIFKKILRDQMNILDFSNEMKSLAMENNLLGNKIDKGRVINMK